VRVFAQSDVVATEHHARARLPLPGVVHRFSHVTLIALVGLTLVITSGTLTRAVSVALGAGLAPLAAPNDRSGAMVVWTPSRLPAGLAATVSAVPGVATTVAVFGGTLWLSGSRDATGSAVDVPPAGRGIPLDLRAADLGAYAALLPPADRAVLRNLPAGEVVLGASSARLRRLDAGATLTVGNTRLRVAGVVPDADVGYAEVFTAPATAATLGVTAPRYLLVQPGTGTTADAAAAAIRAAPTVPPTLGIGPLSTLLGPDLAVLPQVLEKQQFGEFTVHLPPSAGGAVNPDQAWISARLRTATIPLLGPVLCNAAVLPALRAAMEDIVRQGLTSLIHAHQFGGCFAGRVVAGGGTYDISHHAWGSAIDLNVAANPAGGPSHQDPRLVAILRSHGFTWGGTWLNPDPMHFELDGPSA
jgi:hypothetical protein